MLTSPPKDRKLDQEGKLKNEWALLLELRQKEAEQEEMEQKREQLLRKQKYKEELEKMIQNQKQSHMRSVDDDVAMLKVQSERQNRDHEREVLKQMKLKNQLSQCIEQNQSELNIRQRKLEEEKKKDNELIQNVLKQVDYQQQLEVKTKQEQKFKVIKDLNYAYQSQEEIKAKEKQDEKYKDLTIMQQQMDQINAVERGRKQFFDRIKGGFKKNEKVENYYMELNQRKQQEDQQFQEKFIEGVLQKRQQEAAERQQDIDRRKQEQRNKVFNENLNYVEEKKLMARNEQLENEKYDKIIYENSIKYQEEQRILQEKMKSKQKGYFEQLKNQAEGDQEKRKLEGFMNPIEYNLNKNQLEVYATPQKTIGSTNYIPIVPGIAQSRDYQRQKQLSMMDNKLGLQKSPYSDAKRNTSSSQHQRLNSQISQGQSDYQNATSFPKPTSVTQNLPLNSQAIPNLLQQNSQGVKTGPNSLNDRFTQNNLGIQFPSNNIQNSMPINYPNNNPLNYQPQTAYVPPQQNLPQINYQQNQKNNYQQIPNYQQNVQKNYPPLIQQGVQNYPQNVPNGGLAYPPNIQGQNYPQNGNGFQNGQNYNQQIPYSGGSSSLPKYVGSLNSLSDLNGSSSPQKLPRNSQLIQQDVRNSPPILRDPQSYLANQGTRVFA